jgi:hypothetical protein
MVLKSRNATYNWDIYHDGVSNAKDGRLVFTTAAFSTAVVPFGGVDPTSSVFTLNQTFYGNNIDCVGYLWSPVAGYSSFGSYTGNGSADGPFVYTGFRPRWIMIKHYSGSISTQSNAWWMIVDTARNTANAADSRLHAQSSDSEYTGTNIMDIASNGFKIRTGPLDVWNYTGGNYIYAAFAESPFAYSRAR